MIFAVQRYLEDYFIQRELSDRDQYAVKVANVYTRFNKSSSVDEIYSAIHKIRTPFYSANRELTRKTFETDLAKKLLAKFKQSKPAIISTGEIKSAVKAFERRKRRNLNELLVDFKSVVEARSISHFWKSRSKGQLNPKPEDIAELAITQYLSAVIKTSGKGLLIKQFSSGVGYLDIGVILSSVLHLIELKILTTKFTGAEQLEKYMISEGRKEGWLVVIDARAPKVKTDLPSDIRKIAGKIHVIVIDINPPTPSSFSK